MSTNVTPHFNKNLFNKVTGRNTPEVLANVIDEEWRTAVEYNSYEYLAELNRNVEKVDKGEQKELEIEYCSCWLVFDQEAVRGALLILGEKRD